MVLWEPVAFQPEGTPAEAVLSGVVYGVSWTEGAGWVAWAWVVREARKTQSKRSGVRGRGQACIVGSLVVGLWADHRAARGSGGAGAGGLERNVSGVQAACQSHDGASRGMRPGLFWGGADCGRVWFPAMGRA